jgi:hypothetical protein
VSALMTFLCTCVHPLLPALRTGNKIGLQYTPEGIFLVAKLTPLMVTHLRGALRDGALKPEGEADVAELLASLDGEARKAEERLTA